MRVRVLSALVLAPLMLVAVWLDGWIFPTLMVLAALIALQEWVTIIMGPRAYYPLVLASLALVTVLMVGLMRPMVWAVGLAALLVPLVALVQRLVDSNGADRNGDVRSGCWIVACGVPYAAFGALALIWIRGAADGGLGLLLYLLSVIWATDIGAYFAGRRIGGPKLAPRISPNKTWAGLYGGMIAAGLCGGGVAVLAGAGSPLFALLLGALLAVVGQLGDLFESGLKRRYGVKDSGWVIPGHGGVLDRIDGLVVAAPVLAVLHGVWGESWGWW